MGDHSNSLVSAAKPPTSSPISSFLAASPRFLNGLLAKTFSDSETSPTSILDIKNSPPPFGYEKETEAIGLALIDSIVQEESESDFNFNFSKPINRMVLLKVQIPDIINPPPPRTSSSSISPLESPKSPAEFGIKTRNPQVMSPFTAGTRDFNRQLSLKEMELSEDYTCVTTHGPNPKTTHIFDDCVVECCCGDDDDGTELGSECGACKDILGQGK